MSKRELDFDTPESGISFDDQTDDYDEEPDEYEEAMSNCSGFFDGEYFVCGAAGSEQCDWECPFSSDLGLTQKQIDERDAAIAAGEKESGK